MATFPTTTPSCSFVNGSCRCAPAFAAEHGLHAESTPAEIHEVPFINMDDGDAPWMAWADWLAAGGVELIATRRVLFQNYPMVIQQALTGRGVALGWRGLIDELVDGGALTVVGPEVTSRRVLRRLAEGSAIGRDRRPGRLASHRGRELTDLAGLPATLTTDARERSAEGKPTNSTPRRSNPTSAARARGRTR